MGTAPDSKGRVGDQGPARARPALLPLLQVPLLQLDFVNRSTPFTYAKAELPPAAAAAAAAAAK